MIVQAMRAGTFPAGVQWSTGKTRHVTLKDGEELPEWLVEVKPAKPKAKAKAKKTDSAG